MKKSAVNAPVFKADATVTTRTETDSLGEVKVPADKLWGGANPTVTGSLQHWQGPDSP